MDTIINNILSNLPASFRPDNKYQKNRYIKYIECINSYIEKHDPKFNLANKNITCYVVGDGVKPKIGSLIAYNSNWNVHSIDPYMLNYDEYLPSNLHIHKKYGEDIIQSLIDFNDRVLIIFPRSHIHSFNDIYKHFRNKKVWILAEVCCYKNQHKDLMLGKAEHFKISDTSELDIYNNDYMAIIYKTIKGFFKNVLYWNRKPQNST